MTHVLQAFDVGVANGMKQTYASVMSQWPKLKDLENLKLSASGRARLIACAAIEVAWERTVNPMSAFNAFKECGIHPFNPGHLMTNPFVIDDDQLTPEDREKLKKNDHSGGISGKWISEIKCMLSIMEKYQIPNFPFISAVKNTGDLEKYAQIMFQQALVSTGRLLNQLPSILLEVAPRTFMNFD
jgi:hypothetical protein